MSWRKKKKQIDHVKHKVKLVVGLMFAVVIGLIILLCFKILNPGDYYKVESRVENVAKIGKIKDSEYEAIGWLKIQGTDVDVPILYSENKSVDFPVEVEDFVWTNNTNKDFTRQINISGHNIFNLSAHPKIKSDSFHRLEQLMAFIYYDFAKNNEYIQLTWDGKDYIYKIFYVGFIGASDSAYISYLDNVSDEMVEREEKLLRKTNLYNYDIDINEDDKLITINTCTRFNGADKNDEFYVVGRMLREGEKINHYKVTKSSNYNEIEKKLKGDEK